MNSKGKGAFGNYCWNTEGIWAEGGGTCPALAEFIHCRNCKVFQAGAKMLLEAPPPEGYIGEWAGVLAGGKSVEEDLSDPVLIFRLGEEWLAMRAAAVKAVSRPCPVHRIPGKTDEVLLGLVNIGGCLELCFSLATMLGVEQLEGRGGEGAAALFGSRLITMEKDGVSWVFQADEILDLGRYRLKDVGNVPSTVFNARSTFVMEVFRYEERSVGLVDDELVAGALARRMS